MPDIVLTMTGVEAGYGGGLVLQGMDLALDRGTITCIVGPNGAGKSTVFRVISGLLKARSGSVKLGEREINGLDPAEILRAGIAQVPQNRALFPEMSIRDNLLLGGYAIRRDRALLKKRTAMVEEMIPLIKERASEHAGNLSGGQRRMVEIGRALMLDPSLVLMDEPSLGLDPKSVAKVSELIKTMAAEGRTVLLVEQNVRLGMHLATHGIVMEQGQVRLTGDAKDIADNPEVASMYLGKASGI
ncbi:MAG: ABC transporter ATP-binding protein [Candidatus Nanopelagicales bacterium]|jgi:ABC-type branched-subunit amino acid transport system ATPase component|nr:ABC transporter ATP-binding protein [Candidatus Nanopelagicales bacterium]